MGGMGFGIRADGGNAFYYQPHLPAPQTPDTRLPGDLLLVHQGEEAEGGLTPWGGRRGRTDETH